MICADWGIQRSTCFFRNRFFSVNQRMIRIMSLYVSLTGACKKSLSKLSYRIFFATVSSLESFSRRYLTAEVHTSLFQYIYNIVSRKSVWQERLGIVSPKNVSQILPRVPISDSPRHLPHDYSSCAANIHIKRQRHMWHMLTIFHNLNKIYSACIFASHICKYTSVHSYANIHMPVDGASWKSGAGASDLGVCSPSGRLYKNWVHNWVKEICLHV